MTRNALALIALWIAALPLPGLVSEAHAIPARFGLSPDNSNRLLLSTLRSARRKIVINMYQWDSPEILDAVLERIASGVTVTILIEGEPLGSVSPVGKKALLQLKRAMVDSGKSAHRLFVMTNEKSNTKRRYRYDHAKYVIVDSTQVLLCSENFTPTGHPLAGKVGNRGWEIVLNSSELADQLMQVFKEDTSLKFGDVKEMLGDDTLFQGETRFTRTQMKSSKNRSVPAIAPGEGDVDRIELLTSPDSLDGLLSFIHSARDTLDVEQMSFPAQWAVAGEGPKASPMLSEIVAAAKRGVKVRALLNDDSVFNHDSEEETANDKTVAALRDLARCYNLPIEARIVDIKKVDITYIHNKGMLADGERALVSSINWTKNAVMNNRETGLVLDSSDAARYYGGAFDFDWKSSGASNFDEDNRVDSWSRFAGCPNFNASSFFLTM